MPWHIEPDSADCGGGFAVVKDADGSVAGCHDTREQADAQLAALYANEPDAGVADAMQPDMPMTDPEVLQDEFAVGPDGLQADDSEAYAALFPTPTSTENTEPCYGVACVEGLEDGADPPRTWLPGSLTFAPLPWPLKWQPAEDEGHEGSVVVGRVDAAWRDGALIRWAGVIDMGSVPGREIHRLVRGEFVRGVSIKADDIRETEIETLLMPIGAFMDDAEEYAVDDGEDFHLPGKHNQASHGGGKAGSQHRIRQAWKRKNPGKSYADASPSDAKRMGFTRSDRPDRYAADGVVVAHGEAFDYDEPTPVACIYHHGRIRSLTIVAEPAYVEATISLGDSPFRPIATPPPSPLADVQAEMDAMDAAQAQAAAPVVAAGYTLTIPELWPEWWFNEPSDAEMAGLTAGAVAITPEGRVYGLLAPGRVDHRAFRGGGERITAPRGIDYSEWQNKACIVAGADGMAYKINAGTVTFDCGHASPVDPRRADPSFASQHYDNACSVAMRARAGENRYGTWFAGGLAHGLTADAFERIMGCALSGDWQGGKLKGALLVPVEGFPHAVTASVREKFGTLVASSVPIRFNAPAPTVTVDLDPVWALIASATGRGPEAAFADLASERFTEIANER